MRERRRTEKRDNVVANNMKKLGVSKGDMRDRVNWMCRTKVVDRNQLAEKAKEKKNKIISVVE